MKLINSCKWMRPGLGMVAAVLIGVMVGNLYAAQPNMDAALASLQAARTSLKEAEANKGGHRDKAIALVDQAIEQVKLGINYAK